MKKTNFKINISGEDVDVKVYVNKDGNLEIENIGECTYVMYDSELILMKYDEDHEN
jgi:hypothetical protein